MGSSGYEKKYNKSICFFKMKEKIGIGFLCLIHKADSNETIPVLITNSTFLPLSNTNPREKIEFTLNKKNHTLSIDESRKIFSNENEYNITMIEIKKEDNIEKDSFFDIDINDNLTIEDFKKKSVSLITIKNGKIDLKKCKIQNKGITEKEFEYKCDLKEEVYGCPLIDTKSDKIIGVQKTINKLNGFYTGILLVDPIKEFFKPKKPEKLENYELKEEEIIKTKKSIKESIRSNESFKQEKKENIVLLTYLIPKEEKFVRIFGSKFVENNKNNAVIMIYDFVDDKTYVHDLHDFINVTALPDYKNKLKTFTLGLIQTEYFIDCSYMFQDCYYLLTVKDISNLNTEKTTNMSYMFAGCDLLTKIPEIGNLNLSQVNDLSFMFGKCPELKELPDLSKWDTSKVKSLTAMFTVCVKLESIPGMEKWDVSNVTNVSFLFNECPRLIFPDISNWNTSNFVDMSFMFKLCENNLPDMSKWDLKNVKNLEGIFMATKMGYLPDISNWNISNVESLKLVFGETEFKTLPDISKWNTSKVRNMAFMFGSSKSLKSLPDISNWDTSNVESFELLFANSALLEAIPDISKWNTSKVKNIRGIFNLCKSIKSLPDISNWDTSNVTEMSNVFSYLTMDRIPDISKWNTSKVNNMSGLFLKNEKIISLPDISKWNTSNVVKMDRIFEQCISLTEIPDISIGILVMFKLSIQFFRI